MGCKSDLVAKVSDRPGNHQTVLIKSAKKFVLWGAVFVFVLSTASSTAAQVQVDEPREMLRRLIQAIEAIENPETGRGSVLLKMHDYEGDREKIMDFVFKDRLSRSDRFAYASGRRGEREVCWAVGRKCSVVCNDFNAVVQVHPQKEFHRRFGYDFHPETFLCVLDDPLPEHLEALIKGPGNISIRFGNNSILHITASYKDEKIYACETISIDAAKGYRPVSWKEIMEYPNQPERNKETNCEIEWQKYGSTWYVKSAEFKASWTSRPQADPPVKRKHYKRLVKLTVKEFHPDVEISDSEFTLEGLHLPQGMIVLDRVAGVHYRYGSGLRGIEELEEPLLQAEFAKSIEKQLDTKDVDRNTTAIDDRTESDKKTSISNEESMRKELADTLSPRTNKTVLVIVASFIGIALVLVFVVLARKFFFIREGK